MIEQTSTPKQAPQDARDVGKYNGNPLWEGQDLNLLINVLKSRFPKRKDQDQYIEQATHSF